MRRLVAITIGLLMTCCLFTQEQSFLHYTVDDGLPSSHVYYAIQDHQGYMWFGTDKGLCRFDGYGYKTFTVADGLPFNDVWKMFEDSQGRIWLGTFGPDIYYIQNDSVVQVENLNKKLGSASIIDIKEDQNNNIWINFSRGNSLYRYKEDKLFHINTANAPTLTDSQDKETNGDFLASRTVVHKIYNDSCYFYRTHLFAKRLPEIIDNHLHLGTRFYYVNEFMNLDTSINFYNNHLYISTKDSLIDLEFPIEHCTGYPKSIKGTSTYIFKCDTSILSIDKNLNTTNEYDFLNNFKTRMVVEDQNNNLWIPTDNDGVFMRPSSSFYTRNYKKSNGEFSVKSLSKTPDGILWIGTGNGKVAGSNGVLPPNK